MFEERKLRSLVVHVSGENLMVTPEEVQAGKTILKLVEEGLVAPPHVAEHVKTLAHEMKFYWPGQPGGENEFQGALLLTPQGEKFFLTPEVYMRAKERFERFRMGKPLDGE
jgi:hypothetical protein